MKKSKPLSNPIWNQLLIILFFTFSALSQLSAINLEHPADKAIVKGRLPYFKWTDIKGIGKSKSPAYPGKYQIQVSTDSAFADILVDEEVPAILHWYSPTDLLDNGATYYWRVRYLSDKFFKSSSTKSSSSKASPKWTQASVFTLAKEKVFSIPKTAGWDEVRSIAQKAIEYGRTSPVDTYSVLRFPKKGHLKLVQNPGDEKTRKSHRYLFFLNDAKNLTIEGNRCKITLTATHPQFCGIFSIANSSNVMIRNLIMDYDINSQTQYGGAVTDIDHKNKRLTFKVDEKYYPKLPQWMAKLNTFFFLKKGSSQRIGYERVRYYAKETWKEAQHKEDNSLYTFNVMDGWEHFIKELEVGDSALYILRGGDVFTCQKDNNDIVFYNNKILSGRSRWVVIQGKQGYSDPASGKGAYYVRNIKNQYLRKEGLFFGTSSGGMNDWGEYTWHEDNVFEYSHDDMCHISHRGNIGNVVKNNQMTGARRNTIWVHGTRNWVTGNQLKYCGESGIQLGFTGIKHPHNSLPSHVIVENNTIDRPNLGGIIVSYALRQSGDPHIGPYSKDIIIRSNTIIHPRSNPGIEIFKGKDILVENNVIKNKGMDYWPWAEDFGEESKSGIWIGKSQKVSLKNNTIDDKRLKPKNHIVFSKRAMNGLQEYSERTFNLTYLFGRHMGIELANGKSDKVTKKNGSGFWFLKDYNLNDEYHLSVEMKPSSKNPGSAIWSETTLRVPDGFSKLILHTALKNKAKGPLSIELVLAGKTVLTDKVETSSFTQHQVDVSHSTGKEAMLRVIVKNLSDDPKLANSLVLGDVVVKKL